MILVNQADKKRQPLNLNKQYEQTATLKQHLVVPNSLFLTHL